jgi:hypothetical protein
VPFAARPGRWRGGRPPLPRDGGGARRGGSPSPRGMGAGTICGAGAAVAVDVMGTSATMYVSRQSFRGLAAKPYSQGYGFC